MVRAWVKAWEWAAAPDLVPALALALALLAPAPVAAAAAEIAAEVVEIVEVAAVNNLSPDINQSGVQRSTLSGLRFFYFGTHIF